MEDKLSRADLAPLLSGFIKADDLIGELEIRPTKTEVNRWLDMKAEESDLRQEVQRLNEKVERLTAEINSLQASTASVTDVSSLRDKLDRKVDVDAFRDAVKDVVTVDELQDCLAKKADIEEIEELLEQKVDGQDLDQIISAIEKKVDSNVVEEIYELVKQKAEAKDVEMLSVAINKKADRKPCDETSDQLMTLRKEVQSLLEEFDQAFSEIRALMEKNRQDLDTCSKEIAKKATKVEISETKTLIAKRVETSLLMDELAKIRDDIAKETKNAKSEAEKGKYTQERKLDSERKAVAETVKLLKTEMETLLTDKSREIEEIVKFIKGLHENNRTEIMIEIEACTNLIKETKKKVEILANEKADSNEVRSLVAELNKVIKMKVDIDEVQASLDSCIADSNGKLLDLRQELLTSIKNMNTAFVEQLSKKPNAIDVKKQLASKVDNDSIEQMLENYLRTLELEGLGEKVRHLEAQTEVLSQRDDEAAIHVIRENIEDIKRSLVTKANLQEISAILDQKCNINDLNNRLKMIKTMLLEKCSLKELDLVTKEQAMINEFLCAENVIARWRWRSGSLQNKCLVPWEEMTMNTLTDNFLWEKNDTFITVITPGLYEITFGLFSKKKPSSQFLVNGEPVLSLMNSTAYAVHHSSGKLKDLKSNASQGNSSPLNSSVPTGLTYIEFLMLPPRARISLSYTCDSPGEGFLSIRRLT